MGNEKRSGEESVGLDSAERVNLLVAGGAVAAAAALASPAFTASLALGAGMEVLNYRVLRRSTEALFAGRIAGGGSWSGGFGLRFGLLAAAMTAALAAGAHPVGLVIGLSTMVPAVVIAALRNPPQAGPGALPAPPPNDPCWEDWNAWLARERDRDEDEGDPA